MDSVEDQGRAWMLADEHKFKMKRIREKIEEDRRRAEQLSLEEHRVAGEYWKKKAEAIKQSKSWPRPVMAFGGEKFPIQMIESKKKKPMPKRKSKATDMPRPVTDVNWIPVAIPPLKEGRYLVWVRQNGSVLQGKMSIFYWYPNSAKWEWTFKKKEGDQVDLWADVLPPFYTEGA